MRSNTKMESYVWKGSKKRIAGEVYQDITRLVDASEEQLNSFYEHCRTMLYNDDKRHPGRYVLLNIISEQINKCGVELFLRSLEAGKITRYSFLESIRTFMEKNAEVIRQVKEHNIANNLGPITLDFMTSNCPDEYSKLPLDLIMDGCWDRLGKFNNQHITLTFILKQGVWFTFQESKDLTEKDEETGKPKDKLAVVKERLSLKPETELYVNPKGLTYAQLRAMIQLVSKKYADLTTEQLSTLRYKMLFLLENQVNRHISQWEERMRQIEEVAEFNGIILNH